MSSPSAARFGTYPAAPAPRAARTELGDRVDAALAREHQVEEDEIGLQCPSLHDGLLCGSRFADDRDVAFALETAPHAGAQKGVVVDEEHADHSAAPVITSIARVPPAGRGVSSTDAPWRAARRRISPSPRPLPPA
jgi:hypothetical protein